MRPDNPACLECPKGDGGLHYWIKEITPPRGAICLNCKLRINEADAKDIGFDFRSSAP